MIVGLSRRLYEACKNLADEDQQPGEGEDHRPEEQIAVAIDPEREYERFDLDEKVDQYTRERRAAFVDRERDAARRSRLSAAAREGFEYGRNNSWRQLLEQEQEPSINSNPAPGLLESATADTYLAIDRLSVVP